MARAAIVRYASSARNAPSVRREDSCNALALVMQGTSQTDAVQQCRDVFCRKLARHWRTTGPMGRMASVSGRSAARRDSRFVAAPGLSQR
jgi:hypothetical protein